MDDHDARRRAALGAFLRSRRERLTPEDVGLADSLRPMRGATTGTGSHSGPTVPAARSTGSRPDPAAAAGGSTGPGTDSRPDSTATAARSTGPGTDSDPGPTVPAARSTDIDTGPSGNSPSAPDPNPSAADTATTATTAESPPTRKANPRRRTPGLRREEVALLSGVSFSWYSWLEQGRPIAASRQVLDALAATLRLTAAERRHVFELAGETAAAAVEAPAADGCPAVGEHLRATVAALAPVPACILDLHWDILAYNDAEAALYGGLDHLPPARRNMIWLYFGWPGMRTLLKDFETEAWSVLAQFRASADRHLGDPRFAEILADVTAADPDFPRRWDRHDIAGWTPALKRFTHPEHGPLTFRQTKLLAAEDPDLHLLARHPADPSTRRTLNTIASFHS